MIRFTIIGANPSDVDVLEKISRTIFYNSFHAQNTEANMQAYMDHAYNQDKLLQELNDDRVEYYFLCDQDKKIGFLKLNKAGMQSDVHDPESLEIERIYVDHDYQNQGLGAMLMNKALERARVLNLKFIWLGVWEKNPDAIRFYQRLGYEIFGSHKFIMGDEVQTDILMKLRITYLRIT